MIKILEQLSPNRPRVKAVLFDFDGTLSTLRHGWETVMEPLCLEMIAGDWPVTSQLETEVRHYIEQSTGIQTIHQMIWLAQRVKSYGCNSAASEDPWWYKNEYNRRLMLQVQDRIDRLLTQQVSADSYLMCGSEAFLAKLKERGVAIYVASGTDHPDVLHESKVLGLYPFFDEIVGAPVGMIECSKETVLKKLIQDYNLNGMEVVVVGDGKVEVSLARQMGAIALGVASDEEERTGFNECKEHRLIQAGAHALIDNFSAPQEILDWLSI